MNGERIRKRRQERISQLIERSAGHSMAQRDPEPDPKLEDPEYAWKHGGNPWSGPHRGSSFLSRLKRSIIFSFMLFIVIWGLFQLETPWAVIAQAWVKDVLSRDLDQNRIAAWYDQYIAGSPSLIPSFTDRKDGEDTEAVHRASADYFRPVATGTVVATFSDTGKGIRIESAEQESVYALAEGRIMFQGYTESAGYTVVIRHADGMQTIYSGLGDVQVKRNDWVKGGERLGRVASSRRQGTGEWFFAVKKDNSYTDPLEVIALD